MLWTILGTILGTRAMIGMVVVPALLFASLANLLCLIGRF
jgi:hypothetical protein